jgi:hypothetical protein
MKAKALRISTMIDQKTWCRPSEGYAATIEIETDDYAEFATAAGELAKSDERWPRGAPVLDYVKLGDKILKRKMP